MGKPSAKPILPFFILGASGVRRPRPPPIGDRSIDPPRGCRHRETVCRFRVIALPKLKYVPTSAESQVDLRLTLSCLLYAATCFPSALGGTIR